MNKTDWKEFSKPLSNYYFSQRLRLHFVEWGNKNNPLVLLIHGGKDHARSWEWVAQDLCKDFHVVAPDLRGHGNSSWAQGSMYSVFDSVLDTVKLLDLFESCPVSIIGHSYGGIIAFLYAGFYPDKVNKLVIIEGLGKISSFQTEKMNKNPIWKRVPEWIDTIKLYDKRSKRTYSSVRQAASRMQSIIPSLSTTQAEHIAEHGMFQNKDGSFSWKYDNYSSILSPIRLEEDEITEIEKKITCPVLLLYGSKGWSQDPLNCGRKNQFCQAKSICIPGAGHWLHHDRINTFLNTVRPFLKQTPLYD